MEDIENKMSELDDLKQQYATLKEQFDHQQIVNDNLMKSAIRSKTKYFRRYRKEVIFVYPIITAFIIWFLWHHVGAIALGPSIALVIFMAACTFFELRITRHVGHRQVENNDLLTLSRQTAQANKNYLIYIMVFLMFLVPWFLYVVWKLMGNHDLTNNDIPRFLLMALLTAIISVICVVKFIREGNGVLKQIEECLPDTKELRVARTADLYKIAGILLGAFYFVSLGINMFHVINGMVLITLFVAFLGIVYCNFLTVFLCRNAQQSRLLSIFECHTAAFAIITIQWFTHSWSDSSLLAIITAALLLTTAVIFLCTRKRK